MAAALERAGLVVEHCHVKLWDGIQDRVNAVSGEWKHPRFWWRIIKAYFELIRKFLKTGDFDILMVGYPGQFDVFLARILANFRKKPLVWDVLMSIYLVAKDRKLDETNKFIVNLIKSIEAKALRLPDLLIQDTSEYVKWFQENYGIPKTKFCLIPIGADDQIFSPKTPPLHIEKSYFEVLYYGTFIPNHGVMKIVEAANELRSHQEVIFKLIGDGPDRSKVETFVQENDLDNVKFYGWMEKSTLLTHIARADICLGAFGSTTQSLMTVHNKIYECMAMGKPIITGASPALIKQFPMETILTCQRDHPSGLSNAILELLNHPEKRERMAKLAMKTFDENYSIQALGKRLKSCLNFLT